MADPKDPKRLPPHYFEAEPVFEINGVPFLSGATTANVSVMATVTHFTPETAAALVDMERAKAEAERHRADAAIKVAVEETKQRQAAAQQAEHEAAERTKQEQETTAQAREGTVQSRHKVYRVLVSAVTLGGGITACALVPAAAGSIATMVSAVLAVAVGGSYAVEAINKRTTKALPASASDRSAGKPPEGGTGR